VNIVDNSPELPFDDPAVQAVLAGTAKPEPKSDAKLKDEPSSDSLKAEDSTVVKEDPEQLKAQIEGLKAELGRRKGNADQVERLSAELESLKTQVKSTKTTDELAWIQQLDDDGLASKHTDWDDELADARARYGQAEEAGNDRAMAQQGQRILTAKKYLAAFRKETLARVTRRSQEAEDARRESTSIQDEVSEMYDYVSEAYPDLLKEGTPLWKAGDAEYRAYPALMSRLGPLGQIVAASLAISKHPDLVGKKGSAVARKEVINDLEKSVKRSLSTGASAPSPSPTATFDVSSPDGLAQFNAAIEKIKGG